MDCYVSHGKTNGVKNKKKWGIKMVMMDYKKLMTFGFKENTARSIIREAKIKLIHDGYLFYENQRCGVVPAKKVEEILGVSFTEREE